MQDRLKHFSQIARRGTIEDVDILFSQLNEHADIPLTKIIDLCIGLVKSEEGLERIQYYLFSGTQMQRNYATLCFARRNDWDLVNKAYRLGLIDYIQAYSR
ncbi:MAG: hypothetical protein JXJ04_23670 [Spirochaetales bacterium]|nr:hypothetical protein [Spirochaetales bacterium]